MSWHDKRWQSVCSSDDLVHNSGVCVLVNEDTAQEQQVALFSLGGNEVYALQNYDPIGKANVLYRGIIGTVRDRVVVASPLYKQHFDLISGECLEDGSVSVTPFKVRINQQTVELFC